MAEKSRDNGQTSETSKQQSTATVTKRSGTERENARPERNNQEPPSISKWNSTRDGTSESFNSSRNNNNADNSSLNYTGRFGSRSGGGGFSGRSRGGRFGSGTFGSNTDSDSRTCYNCNKTGHISRNCPESRKETRGDDDRNVIFTSTASGGPPSMLITIRNSKNQTEDNQDNNSDIKPTFNNRRGRIASRTSDSNNAENPGRCMVFYNSNMGSGGFRGNRGVSGSNYSNKPSHQSRAGSHANAQPTEHYIPPSDEAITKGENFEINHQTQVRCFPEDKIKPIGSFQEANLGTQVLSNIRRAHFEEPTSIQRYVIPCIRQRNDVIACAPTKSGTTTAFLLPLISNLLEYHSNELSQKYQPPSPLCLILSPTRDLALQTEHEAKKFAYQTGVTLCSVIGGHDMHMISNRLEGGCHILSATAGRLKDMVEKDRISLTKVKYFVLLEADRILGTSFEDDIHQLEDLGLPQKNKRFTSMFSTTFPDELQKRARQFLRENYIFITVDTIKDISETIEEVRKIDKIDRLLQLFEQNLKSQYCLIFVETKQSADDIGAVLSHKNVSNVIIHDDRTEKQCFEVVQEFTNGKYQILIITSNIARHLGFPSVDCIVNYDLPDSIDFYSYCISQTGKSISFFDPDRISDCKIAFELVSKLTETGQEVPEFLKRYANEPSTEQSVGSRNQAANVSEGTTFSNTAEEGGDEEGWEDEDELDQKK